MNFKQFLLPVSLALITTWAIQYFFINKNAQNGKGSSGIQSGQTFIAPVNAAEAQPLNKEVDYILSDLQARGIFTSISTPSAEYLFSSQGGCLSQLTFKRTIDGKAQQLRTINSGEGKQYSFLVALNTKTPLNHTLVNQKRLEMAHQITYKVETDQAIIQKIFTVYDNKMEIDLDLSITPKRHSIQARLFFGSPVTLDITNDDHAIAAAVSDPYNIVSGIYNTQKGSIKKEPLEKIDLHQGWFVPTFFGSENRYFVHALIADQNHFANRAYYAATGKTELVSILESPDIAIPTQWHMSFYFGPKEDAAMSLVDPRLQQTLEHSGLLAPLSRFLLMILNFLYNYVHNYGWAIILMTLLINLVLLPLNIRSAKSLKKYGEFQKKLAYIQARYKNDPDTLSRERSELISKHGLPMGGCLPKLLQLPIFFALSRVLSGSFELYHAPFLWMRDLSAKDPYYVLPISIVMCMILQANATDPKQRFMVMGIALIFGAAAANFSAGLSLYILVGVILNGLQMYLQTKFNWA